MLPYEYQHYHLIYMYWLCNAYVYSKLWNESI